MSSSDISSNGPLWGFFPLLLLVSFFEFSLGLVHVAFCLPFYFLLLPILNGLIGQIASIHALMLNYPNRCDFYLQATLTVLSFIFFTFSVMETYCLVDSSEDMEEGICYGLHFRTLSIVQSCFDFLGSYQNSFLNKINWQPEDRESVRTFVSTVLTILSLLHLISSTVLTVYTAVETKIRLYSYHYQVAIGILITFTGLIHNRYCCTYYFLWLPSLIGLYAIVQGAYTWRNHCCGAASRSLNIVGAACSVLLLACASFGLFCWSFRHSSPSMLVRYCHWRSEAISWCNRGLAFSVPYINWDPQETAREIAVIQIVVYIALFIMALLSFSFSMKSTFSTRKYYMYY